MILNDAGKVADDCWQDIPNHFPNAVLHEHVVMPNHIHGIIEIQYPHAAVPHDIRDSRNARDVHHVGGENFQPLRTPENHHPDKTIPDVQQHDFQKMIPRSIGSIVKGFKIGVTKWFRDIHPADFPHERKIWQRYYHDHIIRDQISYLNISAYIANNPKNWKEDRFWS